MFLLTRGHPKRVFVLREHVLTFAQTYNTFNMPARKSSVSAKVVISRKAKTTKGKAKEAVEVDAKAEVKKVVKTVAEEITPADLFQTFTTDIKLQCGLNIVRSLGGDKYEVINLDFASANTIGSKEFAEFIKNVPERLAAMTIDKKQWDGAITKCSVAVRVTGKLFVT